MAGAGWCAGSLPPTIPQSNTWWSAPFTCPQFTLSVEQRGPVRAVRLDGQPLAPVADAGMLAEGTYLQRDGRLYLCRPLQSSRGTAGNCGGEDAVG